MGKSITLLALSALSAYSYASPASPPRYPLRRQTEIGGIVNTTVGQVQGTASDLRSDVSAYLGIPFAQPPVGDLRFAAPVAPAVSNATIDATAFGADCPCNRIPTHEAYTAGTAGQAIVIALAQTNDILDEDCLTLNVWTKPQSGETSKAVLFWIYGGGFSTGNTANPIYDGAVLADENDVVVVSVNYRLNILGFSAAPGEDTNVGILDQRLALEWTRDNIAAFGGDPSRITVFGQSAGGASTDLVGYGWPDDPIAHALIPQSGVANSVIGTGTSQDSVLENWYTASSNAGCGGEEAGEATVACMKTKTWQEIMDAIESISSNGLLSGFGPFPDNKTIPSNLQDIGAAGGFAKLPYLTGNTDNEAAFFIIVAIAYTTLSEEFADYVPVALLQPILDVITLDGFTCPASDAVNYRVTNGVPAWRYIYYGGNYSNTYIRPLGSDYHTSELPIVFGTTEYVTGEADTDVEAAAGTWMRNAWATFAKDPVDGLTSLGWPQASADVYDLYQLSYENQTTPSTISSLETDFSCDVLASFTDLISELSSTLTSLLAIYANGTSDTNAAYQKLSTLEAPTDASSMTTYLNGLTEVVAIVNEGSNSTTTTKRGLRARGPRL